MADDKKPTIYEVVALVFDGKDTAGETLKDINSAKDLDGIDVFATAVVEKDEKGKVHVKEHGKGGVGTAAGAVTGGLIGLIGGPAGFLAWLVGGAVVGGVAGKYLGRPVDKDDLEALGNLLTDNKSAILVVAEDTVIDTVSANLSSYNAEVTVITLGDEVSGEIKDYQEKESKDADAKSDK